MNNLVIQGISISKTAMDRSLELRKIVFAWAMRGIPEVQNWLKENYSLYIWTHEEVDQWNLKHPIEGTFKLPRQKDKGFNAKRTKEEELGPSVQWPSQYRDGLD